VTQASVYVDLRGRQHSLDALDADERKLVTRFKRRAASTAEYSEYHNFWLPVVAEFYKDRGLTKRQIVKTTVYRIAQDLGSRLMVDQGLARAPDYRSELAELVRSKFKTRREFCQKTGLSEDMLSHVLAGRKNMSIDALTGALDQIGYTLRIVPKA
jgi:hypothetical protein